jgi:nucleoside-diphosphate-sugar epimerase
MINSRRILVIEEAGFIDYRLCKNLITEWYEVRCVDNFITGAESHIKPLPHNDPNQWQPDITLPKEALDWQPKVQLLQGLEKTIAYFKGKV